MTRHWHSLIHWRRESVLDVYEIAIGLFLFAAPWLFAYTGTESRLEAWGTGIAIMLISLLAVTAFADWEE